LEIPGSPDEIKPLADAALGSGLPLDLSAAPALWGGQMRGTEAVLACVGSYDYEIASDTGHAIDLVQAHLIESLSCIGRDYWDFYFFRVRAPVSEAVLAGVLEALEMARQEGHIRFVGLCNEGPPMNTYSLWQLHDGFEALLVRDAESLAVLGGLAKHRRVATIGPDGADAMLLSVKAAVEIPCA
jgi:aryl-alcohol dehydrogenase-like predicted oxidoreductase